MLRLLNAQKSIWGGVMVSVNCRLDKIENHLGGHSLDMLVQDYLDEDWSLGMSVRDHSGYVS